MEENLDLSLLGRLPPVPISQSSSNGAMLYSAHQNPLLDPASCFGPFQLDAIALSPYHAQLEVAYQLGARDCATALGAAAVPLTLGLSPAKRRPPGFLSDPSLLIQDPSNSHQTYDEAESLNNSNLTIPNRGFRRGKFDGLRLDTQQAVHGSAGSLVPKFFEDALSFSTTLSPPASNPDESDSVNFAERMITPEFQPGNFESSWHYDDLDPLEVSAVSHVPTEVLTLDDDTSVSVPLGPMLELNISSSSKSQPELAPKFSESSWHQGEGFTPEAGRTTHARVPAGCTAKTAKQTASSRARRRTLLNRPKHPCAIDSCDRTFQSQRDRNATSTVCIGGS